MIKLRNYQNEAIRLLRVAFKSNRRVVLCLPTGSGKTLTFSEMVRLANEKNTRTLVVTDRTELFKQTIASINKFGVPVEEISPDNKRIDLRATVYLAMCETIKRRLSSLVDINPKLIILDEAHKAAFNKILEAFPEANVIGATATPVGKHFYKYYTEIVNNIDVPDLIDQGFLVDVKAYQMQDDFSDLDTKAGEYTDHSLLNHFDKPKLYDGVIEWWQKYAKGMKTICFNVNIKHTEEMHRKFLEAGISSEIITSYTTSDERKRILSAFKKSQFLVLNNCGILTTGYDEDTIQCVIMNRATHSLPLAMQIPGRGSRPFGGCVNGLHTPEERKLAIKNSPKPYFVYLDFGGNHDRHGLWNEYRKWAIEKPKKKKEGVAPVKMCPNCDAMLHASVMTCKYCDYVFPPAKSTPAVGVMVEVKPKIPDSIINRKVSSLSIYELIELEKSGKYKPTYVWRIIRTIGIDAIKEYAKLKNYKHGWVVNQINKINESGYRDYKIVADENITV